jgi:dephospho-CoA kinase
MTLRIIGLTGLYCAGKNHIAAILEKRGLPVLDVDKLGHSAIEAEKAAIVSRFGEDVLVSGHVDRRRLGEKVFGKSDELAALEAIVHPAANRLTDQWLAEKAGSGATGNACVINAALLHRSSAFPLLDALILVKAPLLIRFLRAKKRDKLSLAALLGRFSSQKTFSSQYFPKNPDTYIVNNYGFPGSERKLEKRIDTILKGL